MLKLTKIDTERFKLSFAMFEDTVKIFCASTVYGFVFMHDFTPSIKVTNFNGFLPDSVEITSCEYTKTIIHLRLSLYC